MMVPIGPRLQNNGALPGGGPQTRVLTIWRHTQEVLAGCTLNLFLPVPLLHILEYVDIEYVVIKY
jgi:hypothetical protein